MGEYSSPIEVDASDNAPVEHKMRRRIRAANE